MLCTPKIAYLKVCVIILRDLSSPQKRILNLPGCLKGWKFDRIFILCYPFGFWHELFFVPPPFSIETYTVKHPCKLFPSCLGVLKHAWGCRCEWFGLNLSNPFILTTSCVCQHPWKCYKMGIFLWGCLTVWVSLLKDVLSIVTPWLWQTFRNIQIKKFSKIRKILEQITTRLKVLKLAEKTVMRRSFYAYGVLRVAWLKVISSVNY